ncbi:MAG: hypothetical protein WKF32_07630 [Thermoleophilaceae bacterium]
MDVLRTRIAALIAACAVAVALPACGDGDGKGAAEELEKGVKKGGNKVEKEGRELEDDARGGGGKDRKEK